MNYDHKDATLLSSDGKTRLHVEIFLPKEGKVRGVVQISHGMTDYVGRYKNLADALCKLGYVVCGNDHLGHGDSVACADDFGYFSDKDGYKLLIDDLKVMNDYVRREFSDVPVVLLGHSMGSFVARLYAVKYFDTLDGIIIHGTAGPNPVLPMGKAVVKTLRLFKGARHRSRLVHSLADGGYNKPFKAPENSGAWLTREPEQVADRIGNPKNDFIFTLAAYGDLFTMLGECNSRDWFKNYPKGLKTLVMSGGDDPVGDFGKGVRYVYDNLIKNGANAELKLYDGARHELFNEINREEVFADINEFMEGLIQF